MSASLRTCVRLCTSRPGSPANSEGEAALVIKTAHARLSAPSPLFGGLRCLVMRGTLSPPCELWRERRKRRSNTHTHTHIIIVVMISACVLLSTRQRSSTISTSNHAKAEIFRMFNHLFNPLRLIINFITKSIDPKIVLSRFCHIKPHEAPFLVKRHKILEIISNWERWSVLYICVFTFRKELWAEIKD